MLLTFTNKGNINIPFSFIVAAPTAAPISFAGLVQSSSSIFLSWTEPPFEHQNGIIRDYHIVITETETANVVYNQSIGGTQPEVTVSSLHPNYNYVCTVAAITVGKGPETAPINLMTLEDGETIHSLLYSSANFVLIAITEIKNK